MECWSKCNFTFEQFKTSGSLVYGNPGTGSGITLDDPKVVTLNTLGGSVFDPTVNSVTIFL